MLDLKCLTERVNNAEKIEMFVLNFFLCRDSSAFRCSWTGHSARCLSLIALLPVSEISRFCVHSINSVTVGIKTSLVSIALLVLFIYRLNSVLRLLRETVRKLVRGSYSWFWFFLIRNQPLCALGELKTAPVLQFLLKQKRQYYLKSVGLPLSLYSSLQ